MISWYLATAFSIIIHRTSHRFLLMNAHTPPLRIGINGFGRIGRMVLRTYLDRLHQKTRCTRDQTQDPQLPFVITKINDIAPLETSAHLLAFDSIHGRLDATVTTSDKTLILTHEKGTHTFLMTHERDPSSLSWHDVDIVLECSGQFLDGAQAQAHISAGAKRVIISAPATHVDKTIVYGVNHTMLSEKDRIISNASCTTNCLAPIAKVIHEVFGIEHGYMTTIHSYTADQRLVDGPHKDLYRARAGALSLIPTTTGAAKAVGLVLPELNGKLDGTAIRVPTPNVSMIDFTFTTKNPISVTAIHAAMQKAYEGPLHGIIALNHAPLVSIDFNGNPHSAIFDCTQTQVLGDGFARILAWYDNEYGFSNRMLDVARYWGSLIS